MHLMLDHLFHMRNNDIFYPYMMFLLLIMRCYLYQSVFCWALEICSKLISTNLRDLSKYMWSTYLYFYVVFVGL